MRQGDAIIVKPWEIQSDERGDVIWVYTGTQSGWLRKNGILKL
jgi:translation initiation factor 1A